MVLFPSFFLFFFFETFHTIRRRLRFFCFFLPTHLNINHGWTGFHNIYTTHGRTGFKSRFNFFYPFPLPLSFFFCFLTSASSRLAHEQTIIHLLYYTLVYVIDKVLNPHPSRIRPHPLPHAQPKLQLPSFLRSLQAWQTKPKNTPEGCLHVCGI